MRHLILPAAALMVLSTAATAFAGAGLPHITSLKAGSYSVNLYNDSTEVQTGANTLTVEVPELPEGHSVRLVLVDAAGRSVPVPLQPLKVLEGPADAHGGDSHGGSDDGHGGGDSHGGSDDGNGGGDSHGDGDGGHGGGHGAEVPGTEGPTFRGKVSLKTAGNWKAVVEVLDDHGKPVASAVQILEVVTGGPSRYFLAFAGLAMGGTMIYGAVERRRQPASRR